MEYVKANVNLVEHIWTEEPSDLRWRHARFLLFQLWGMMDGYNYAAKHFKARRAASRQDRPPPMASH